MRPPSPTSPSNATAPGSWYRLIVNASIAEVLVYDHIGAGGIGAGAFIADLAGLDDKPLTVRINSGGGDVYEAIAIANALRRHPGHVTVVIDGLAASAASFIAVCATETLIARNAELMIHDAAILDTSGNPSELRDLADDLDRISNNIASMYAGKAGGTVEQWREAMRAETWYTAAEAVKAGLADRIVDDTKPATRAQADQLRIVASARRRRAYRESR